MSNKSSKPLDNDTIKLVKGIGHQLKPIVIIGNQGVTQGIIDEINRGLTDHELIKIKVPAGTKAERQELANQLTEQTNSDLVHSIGRMALLFRKNPHANPKLSNLVRHTF